MGGRTPQLIARIVEAKVPMTERSFNLVVPLAHEATAMRIHGNRLAAAGIGLAQLLR